MNKSYKKTIDWSKAPKRKDHILIGHSFDKSGCGWWFLLMIGDSYLHAVEKVHFDFKKPKGLNWKNSFTPAPRKRK